MVFRCPSDALRERRRARGDSLAAVARRAGTSAAALHRYEHGWSRFEWATLEKLARALDCELEVVLRPRAAAARPDRRRVVRQLRRLFWDRPLDAAALERYPAWVLQRALEFGRLDDLRLLRAWMGADAFLDGVASLHFADPRTREFWDQILNLEGRSCTRTFSRRAAPAT